VDGLGRVRDLLQSNKLEPMIVSVDLADDVVVALASSAPQARPGVAVERINAHSDEGEWPARSVAARRAAARSLGVEASQVHAGDLDPKSGIASIRIGDRRAIRIQTERRIDHVWAWTLGTEV